LDPEPTQLLYETNDIEKLNEHFIDYINFGGYPEVSLSSAIQADPGRYIRNDIIDKVLLRDLPLLYGIEDIQELNSLFTYIAYNTGNEMSLDSISQSSGVSKNTIKKYIAYLEAAFLIKVIQRIDNTGKKFRRANFFKIYLINPSLRCALFTPIKANDNFIGNLVETAIFSQWQHSTSPLYYARWKDGEIDIVSLGNDQKPEWIVEIKWSNRHIHSENYSELKNVKSFCSYHKLSTPTVTSLNHTESRKIEDLVYWFIPASLYCYNVGRNLIKYKTL
jgi:predicted AAA+ superfamily ATPase